MEPNERSKGVDEVEIFRLFVTGGLEVRYNDLPIVRLKTNGVHGHEYGITLDPRGVFRLGQYLQRYAMRLGDIHQSHAVPKEWLDGA